jgi:hypothetical protein
MDTSERLASGKYNVMQWVWDASGNVTITIVDNNTSESGTMKYSTKNGKLDKLTADSAMAVKT